MLDVWVHLRGEQDRLTAFYAGLAHTIRRTKGPGSVPLPRGATLTVTLSIEAFGISRMDDTVVWLGESGNASFGLEVPVGVTPGTYLGVAAIALGDVKVTTLQFVISVSLEARSKTIDAVSRETRVRTAFASYATEDRERMLARVQGMQALLPDLDVFVDVVSLRTGERWKERISSEIVTRDEFFLFWSDRAAKSEWVEFEWRTALAIRDQTHQSGSAGAHDNVCHPLSSVTSTSGTGRRIRSGSSSR